MGGNDGILFVKAKVFGSPALNGEANSKLQQVPYPVAFEEREMLDGYV